MRQHLLYYGSLIVLLLGGFIGAFAASGNRPVQMGLIVFVGVVYAVWGIVHHALHHSFSIKIMLEYIAIATLGISLVFFALNVGLSL